MQLHHIAMRVDDLGAVREASEQAGQPTVLMGASRGIRFLYVDARDAVGHYLEYVQFPPE
jgi:hypothetical protein